MRRVDVIPWSEVVEGTERAERYCQAVYGQTAAQVAARGDYPEHVLSADCWCQPTVDEYVPPRGTRVG